MMELDTDSRDVLKKDSNLIGPQISKEGTCKPPCEL